MDQHIKPIETTYKGYRMRSRLEARWACFFDALGLEWQYEAEGITDSAGRGYLPDFWLPQRRDLIEIKPVMPDDNYKARLYRVLHAQWAQFLQGANAREDYQAQDPTIKALREFSTFVVEEWGELLKRTGLDQHLSNVDAPLCYPVQETINQIVDFSVGVEGLVCNLSPVAEQPPHVVLIAGQPWATEYECYRVRTGGKPLEPAHYELEFSGWWFECPCCHTVDFAEPGEFHTYERPGIQPFLYCVACDQRACPGTCHRNSASDAFWFYKGDLILQDQALAYNTPLLRTAYTAARSARFEHGESGAR